MTIVEVAAILERVKDLTNDAGKKEIDRVLQEMAAWTLYTPPPVAKETPVDDSPKHSAAPKADAKEAEPKKAKQTRAAPKIKPSRRRL